MKTKLCISTLCFAAILFSCKKDVQSNDKLSTSTVSNFATDGVVTVQVSILPPVTPQTFIPNIPGGNTSTAAFDVSASKLVFIDYFHMTATYPAILAIGGVANRNGETPVPINFQIFGGQSYTIPIYILYNNVTSTTSPTVTGCKLNTLDYHTADNIDHAVTVNKPSGMAFSMCLVNNVAHVAFQDPPNYKVLANGTVELAEVKLTGDTSWTLNSLPLNFYFSEFSYGNFPTKILVKHNGANIAMDSVFDHGVVAHFKGGFKHGAGKNEILKIYGYNMSVNVHGFFVTEMGDLNGFVWRDGFGGFISGKLNAQFYKEQTGASNLHNF